LRQPEAEEANMVHLDLTQSEAAALAKVLDYYVSELRMEVSDTDQKDVRDALKAEEGSLEKIRRALKSVPERA
jgi:hypothetical protein